MIDPLRTATAARDAYRELSFEVKGDIEVLFRYLPEYQIIAYRGTDSLADAKRDARALPWYASDVAGAFVSKGFLNGARKSLGEVLKRLDPNLPTVTTGHSMGGALAIIMATMLVQLGKPVVGLHTFGAPRAVSPAAWRSLEAQGVEIIQYRRHGDPVTHVPWPGIRCHSDHQVYLPGPEGLDPLEAHRMVNYWDQVMATRGR